MNKTFDLVAPIYVLLERLSFGDALNTARNAFINTAYGPGDILLIGEGNGRFLAECLRNKRGGSITVLDSSEKMLSELRARIKRIPQKTELKLVCEDFLAWQPGLPAFDVVVTHFFLDLFYPASQRKIIDKLTHISHATTPWINIDYKPSNKFGLFRLIDWMQYRFDRLLCGVETDRHYDPSALIKEFGWVVREEQGFLARSVLAHLFVRASPGSKNKVPGSLSNL